MSLLRILRFIFEIKTCIQKMKYLIYFKGEMYTDIHVYIIYIYIHISKNNCGISIYRYNLNIMINLSYFNPYDEFDINKFIK